MDNDQNEIDKMILASNLDHARLVSHVVYQATEAALSNNYSSAISMLREMSTRELVTTDDLKVIDQAMRAINEMREMSEGEAA